MNRAGRKIGKEYGEVVIKMNENVETEERVKLRKTQRRESGRGGYGKGSKKVARYEPGKN